MNTLVVAVGPVDNQLRGRSQQRMLIVARPIQSSGYVSGILLTNRVWVSHCSSLCFVVASFPQMACTSTTGDMRRSQLQETADRTVDESDALLSPSFAYRITSLSNHHLIVEHQVMPPGFCHLPEHGLTLHELGQRERAKQTWH